VRFGGRGGWFACWRQRLRADGRVWAWCPSERTSDAMSLRIGRRGPRSERRAASASIKRNGRTGGATERTAAPTGPGERRVMGRAVPARCR
jgi:hypothetical protein